MSRTNLGRFAWLSIGAALATIALKGLAYWLTGSVGLLSDALESFVNLAAATLALAALSIAAWPPDEMHAFGYSKAEYFASGVEGLLIVLAASGIVWTALPRLIAPRPLQQVGIGLAISALAAALNFVVARRLLKAGEQHRSITLEADAHHLMTDVWTSVGIIAGIGVVALTGWTRLDPLIALAVAGHILWIGGQLLQRSVFGLLDRALPTAEQGVIKDVLSRYESQGIQYHALRTRRAGRRSFISLHVLVPRDWSVQRGHDLLEDLEYDIRAAIPGATVFTHLEPIGDPAAWKDVTLDRTERPEAGRR
ncbi:MAG TPA: cation diffusion facilitator family transporter [candidate division Zixibacteria bacterium]|nr:cation diffusion facilitator family transporter [candidate division Zixibacteria bacterium]